MHNDLLTVELLVDHHIEVVFFLVHIDWNINASTSNLEWDWLRVILVLKEESQVLVDISQFCRDESELNFSV